MNKTTPGSSVLPAQPRAGVCMHITSLPGTHGIGDIGDSAVSFIRSLADMRVAVWQFLPTGPTAYGHSPYLPLSAYAGNENLIGIDPLLRAGLLRESECTSLANLPLQSVDYERLIPAKLNLLKLAVNRMSRSNGGSWQCAFEDFLHEHDAAWLDDYALFRALKEHHGGLHWTQWDKPARGRQDSAISKIRGSYANEIEMTKRIQFLFYRQWRALHGFAREQGVALFSDLPFYIAHDSADAWSAPDLLELDGRGDALQVAGVPPDYFSAEGQLWGNPLYDWAAHAASGYSWWIGRLRHASSMADLVRIDHFRGFESYWSVPTESKTARDGEWIKGPGDDLFKAARAALGHLPLVAEDLGEITPEVIALRERQHIPGMRVLQFELPEPGFKRSAIQVNCVCYTGTHDNNTSAGWLHDELGKDQPQAARAKAVQKVLSLVKASTETFSLDLLRFAFASRARLVVAPLQDYLGLGSAARLNTPGTALGNWRWRVQKAQLSGQFRESVRKMIENASRA